MSSRETADALTVASLVIVTWGTGRQGLLDLGEYRDLFPRIPGAIGQSMIAQLRLGSNEFWDKRNLGSRWIKVLRIAAFIVGSVRLLSPSGIMSYVSAVVNNAPKYMAEKPSDYDSPDEVEARTKIVKKAAKLAASATAWFIIMVGSIVGIVASIFAAMS